MVELLQFAVTGVVLGVLLAPAKSLSADFLRKEPRCYMGPRVDIVLF